MKLQTLQTGVSAVSRDSLRNKRRVVRLVTIVTVMFALSWLPIQVGNGHGHQGVGTRECASEPKFFNKMCLGNA